MTAGRKLAIGQEESGGRGRGGAKWQVTSVARQLPQANSYTRRKIILTLGKFYSNVV